MITKFKIFENQQGDPQIGDYVLINFGLYPHADNELLDDEDIEKIENSVGNVGNIDPYDGYTKYNISLDTGDKNIDNKDVWVDREEIIYFSNEYFDIEMAKEYLDVMIASNKYNI